MIDPAPWVGHRVEGWEYDVLDLDDRVVGRLEDVDEESPGSITRSVHTTPRETATVQLVRRADWDWTRHRVRVTHVLHTATGLIRHAVLTGVVSAPVESHTDETMTLALDLADKTSILAGDSFPGVYGVAEGQPILDLVRSIIASTGDTGILIGDSGDVLAASMTWDADTTKIRQANDLLDAGGFYALSVDGRGAFRADLYVAPEQRGVAWVFDRGYLPTWTRDADVYSVPNRYVCVGRSDGDEAGPVKIAEDLDSPYGRNRVGRWITRTETNVEASDAVQLQALATRKLAAAQTVTETLTITHPWLPIDLNDVVRVEHPRLAAPALCVIQKQTISLELGGLTTSTMRRVG